MIFSLFSQISVKVLPLTVRRKNRVVWELRGTAAGFEYVLLE